jgi:hypothetical protein
MIEVVQVPIAKLESDDAGRVSYRFFGRYSPKSIS